MTLKKTNLNLSEGKIIPSFINYEGMYQDY